MESGNHFTPVKLSVKYECVDMNYPVSEVRNKTMCFLLHPIKPDKFIQHTYHRNTSNITKKNNKLNVKYS